MIQSLVLEFLAPGALPVYETDPDVHYHVLEFGDPLDVYTQEGQWRAVTARNHRLIIPLNIDTDNNSVFTHVPLWVQQAQYFQGEGTLIFTVRTAATFEDGTSLVLAGMAYSERPVVGATSLEGIDPAELIVQLLHNNREHPIVRQALDRADADAREYRRYEIMASAARKIEKKKAHQAEHRAARLLDQHLTHKQRRYLKTKGYVPVRGQDGLDYIIEHRSHQNVFRVEGDLRVKQFCIVSSIRMPIRDLILAQKLLLETDIEHFMKVANQWDLRDRGERVRIVPLPGIDIQFNENLRDLLDRLEPPPVLGPRVAYINVDGVERLHVAEPEQLAEAV